MKEIREAFTTTEEREAIIAKINEELNRCESIDTLDFIYKMLVAENNP